MFVYQILMDTKNFYMECEMVNDGDLKDYVKAKAAKGEKISEAECSYFIREILLALNFLHKRNIAHRDMKAANVLVDKRGTENPLDWAMKVCDLGFATRY